MLNWMFNRQKSKDVSALDDKSAARLRDLAETVRSIAPDEFASGDASGRNPKIPRHKPADDPAIDYAARLFSEQEDGAAEPAGRPDFDSDVRMDVARRLRRHMNDLSPSERLEMVDEFFGAIANMSDCYRPQVIALIEQELGHTPYMTRQAALRLRQDIAAIGRVLLGEYVELLSDADFLDILRGRGEFVLTAAARADAEREAAAEARLARDREQKGGLLNRFLSGDEAPRNVVALDPQMGRHAEKSRPADPDREMLDGRNKISRQAQRRVAHFILASLFDTLVERGRLRTEVARAMRQSVRQRIEKARFENRLPMHGDMIAPESEIETVASDEAPQAAAVANAPVTIDHYVLDALSRSEDALVVQGLAHHAQIPAAIVSKILDSGSARAITALAWRAGLTAPSALVLQMSAGIAEDSLERPAAGGRYAMAATDMDWYIDFFNELQPSGPRGRGAGRTTAPPEAAAEKSKTGKADKAEKPEKTESGARLRDRMRPPKGE